MPARTRLLRVAAAVLAAATLLALPVPAHAVRTLGLSAPSFEFNVAPNGTGKGEIIVVNDGTEPLKVQVYAANQRIGTDGKVTYLVPRPGETNLNTDPAAWVRIAVPQGTKAIGNVPYLELDPGERERVTFDFRVPPAVPPGDHQVLVFFEMFEFPKAGQGAMSTVQGRLGSRIRMRVQGQFVERFDVRPFTVRQFVIGDLMPYSAVLRNDGNLDTEVESSLVILDSNENELQRSTVVTRTAMYANTLSERQGTIRLTKAPFGIFTARLTTTWMRSASGQPTPDDVTKDRTIYVLPLWLVIAVVAAVGALLLWGMWKAAVRTAARQAAAVKAPPRGESAARRAAREADEDEAAAVLEADED